MASLHPCKICSHSSWPKLHFGQTLEYFRVSSGMHNWSSEAAFKNGLQLVLPAKQEVIFAISKMFSQSSLGSVRPLDNKKLNLVSMFQTLGVCVQIFYVIWNSRSPSTTRCQERTCSAEFDLLLLGKSTVTKKIVSEYVLFPPYPNWVLVHFFLSRKIG